MATAPVCHIPVDEVISQPQPAKFPPLSRVNDLTSLLNTVNNMVLILEQLTGQTPTAGPVGLRGTGGAAGSSGVSGSPGKQGKNGKDGKDGKPAKTGSWTEDRSQRVEEKIKIYQDNDNTSPNWVEIKRINRVVFTNNAGQTIVWKR